MTSYDLRPDQNSRGQNGHDESGRPQSARGQHAQASSVLSQLGHPGRPFTIIPQPDEQTLLESARPVLDALRKARPMIHCLTNPLAIRLSADAVLAWRARPMMAEHPAEVTSIVQDASALLINLGNLTDARIQSMQLAGEKAHQLGIPVVLDPVGAAGSPFRLDLAIRLIHTVRPAVIKGNASEIQALCTHRKTTTGVDSRDLEIEEIMSNAAFLHRSTGACVVTTGAVDYITAFGTHRQVNSGSPLLGRITGSGCLCGTLIATLLATAPGPKRTTVETAHLAHLAVALLAIAGERAEAALAPNEGIGSFQVRLLDALDLLAALA